MCLDIEWIFKLFAEVWDVFEKFLLLLCHVFYCEHFVLYTRVHAVYLCVYSTMYTRKIKVEESRRSFLQSFGRKYDHVKWETCQIIHRRDVVFEKNDISYNVVLSLDALCYM